jgi:hypothetical protein
MGEVEVEPGVEAVRVMSGDNPFGGLRVFARLRGVEVLREILAELRDQSVHSTREASNRIGLHAV